MSGSFYINFWSWESYFQNECCVCSLWAKNMIGVQVKSAVKVRKTLTLKKIWWLYQEIIIFSFPKDSTTSNIFRSFSSILFWSFIRLDTFKLQLYIRISQKCLFLTAKCLNKINSIIFRNRKSFRFAFTPDYDDFVVETCITNIINSLGRHNFSD